MPAIKTVIGEIDSKTALKIFEEHQHPTSTLLNILHQLLEHSQSDAADVVLFINTTPANFSHPVTKLAAKHRFAKPVAHIPGPAHSTTWPDGLGKEDINLLESTPNLFYDPSLFHMTCKELERPHQAELWLAHITDANPEMPAVLHVVPYPFRSMFAQKYVEQFKHAFA